MGQQLPKIIHQTYPSKVRLPSEIQDNIRHLCELNPGWEHRLYDDDDIESFILKNYGLEVLNLYRTINPSYGAARADFFRYLLMYSEGGIYLDIKSSVTQSLDDVINLNSCYILSKWDRDRYSTHGLHKELESLDGGEYQQWHIIAVSGHPFLRSVIESVIKNIQQYNILNSRVGRMGVLRVTGPIAYTLAIESVKSLHPFSEIEITKQTGIEYSLYQNEKFHKKHHKHLFTKHYSDLKSPIITPCSIKSYYLTSLYYLFTMTKRFLPHKIKRLCIDHYRSRHSPHTHN